MTTSVGPSRRDFLATSALGILQLVGVKQLAPEAALADELLYVGTYTEGDDPEGIHLLRFDTRAGSLTRVGAARSGPNPSYLAVHPNGRVLYAVNETTEYAGKPSGSVSAFAISAETGALTWLNKQSSNGGAPCYVSVDRTGRVVLAANYVGGNVVVLPADSSGALRSATNVVQHTGKGPNAERQERPHAHFVRVDPSNRFALVADLGVDRVFAYRLDLDTGTLNQVDGGAARMRPGAGPRHLAFHPGLPRVFVANELDSTVTTLAFDRDKGTLTVRDTRTTLPTGWQGLNYPADIHVAPIGNALYVSNRGHNSIAVFAVDASGAITLEQIVPTEGDWPRNFTIDPTGQWLLVANQRSGSVTVFARDQRHGRLEPTGQRLAMPNPVCLRFLAPTP